MALAVTDVVALWGKVAPYPGGKWLFSRLAGWFVPYSNSIGARVVELRPGFAKVALRDKRRVRNHLQCVHAVALVNLGEFVSGLAMYASLPRDVRGIVVDIHAHYVKKARGDLIATSQCVLPVIDQPIDFTLHAEIRDQQGDIVATVAVIWRLEKRV